MESITIRNVSKSFKIHNEKRTTLKEKILFSKNSGYEEFVALKNVSFDITQGETVGLIGRNGSGKSTLLKILSKIIYPDSGEVMTKGRMSSLLELGAGFHPDFTGKENIYMNASILGLTKKEIDSKLEQIISFSELGEFIDRSVRVYSSGMYMRLAFSVAISVDPDILLIDEVLAVGDSAFQNKCINKIRELKGQGKTIVIVAHDNGVIEKLCDKAVWLHRGEIQEIGNPKEVTSKYMSALSKMEDERLLKEKEIAETTATVNKDVISVPEKYHSILDEVAKQGTKKIEITKVTFQDFNGMEKRLFITGEPMTISIHYKTNGEYESPIFGIGIFTPDNICCYGTNTMIDDVKFDHLSNNGIVNFNIKNLSLISGEYMVDVAIHTENGEHYDYHVRTYKFQVSSNINDIGISRQLHDWEIVRLNGGN